MIARLALAAVLLAGTVAPARADLIDAAYCRLYPSKCVKPEPVVIYVPVPTPAAPVRAPPLVTPQQPVPATTPTPAPRPKARPIRSNFAKPLKAAKRKAAAAKGTVRWWCSFAPAGTTAAQIITEARSRGRTVPAEDAEACAASKKG